MRLVRLTLLPLIPVFVSLVAYAQPENYKGIGIAFGPSIYCDGYYGVTAVLAGGPADLAGIKKDYCIIAVDGVDVKDIPQKEIVDMIKGLEGTTVTLTINWNSKRDIEVYRGDIDPEKFLVQANEKWIAERTTVDGPRSKSFEKRFDGIIYMADAAKSHFETMLDEVEYDPVYWSRVWRFKPAFSEKYVMNGELSLATHYQVRAEISIGASSQKQGIVTFKNSHEVIKYWMDKKLKPKGYVVSEFKNEKSDALTSFFLHQPGDDGMFHQHPQIKFIFSGAEEGKKELLVNIYSAYNEEIKNLPWNWRDPRRNRGHYDMETADACISGDCIDSHSTFIDSSYTGGVHYRYTGEMQNGLAHGNGKLEQNESICEGSFWRGYKDGTLKCTHSWGEVIYERYDKGKYLSGDSEEQVQALEAQKRKNLRPANSGTYASGGSAGYHKIADRSASVVPTPPQGVEELIASIYRKDGFVLVDKAYLASADNINNAFIQFKAQADQQFVAMAVVPSSQAFPHLEVSNLTLFKKQPDSMGKTLNSQGYKIKFMKFKSDSGSRTMKFNAWPDTEGQPVWAYLLMR